MWTLPIRFIRLQTSKGILVQSCHRRRPAHLRVAGLVKLPIAPRSTLRQ